MAMVYALASHRGPGLDSDEPEEEVIGRKYAFPLAIVFCIVAYVFFAWAFSQDYTKPCGDMAYFDKADSFDDYFDNRFNFFLSRWTLNEEPKVGRRSNKAMHKVLVDLVDQREADLKRLSGPDDRRYTALRRLYVLLHMESSTTDEIWSTAVSLIHAVGSNQTAELQRVIADFFLLQNYSSTKELTERIGKILNSYQLKADLVKNYLPEILYDKAGDYWTEYTQKHFPGVSSKCILVPPNATVITKIIHRMVHSHSTDCLDYSSWELFFSVHNIESVRMGLLLITLASSVVFYKLLKCAIARCVVKRRK
ncbi:hypothetical protein QR680_003628 [Steinernema hermaphroditum]|uniref:Uncharacterized protein n=1 Tax=Steinernema hermaphroditum TaxID=289476 RepID=A0AA39LSK7_9BILA|nr:hypothetical protein QR680_003628 [Steinernema hermaphroditum]